jgi:RNA polymerase sigma-70 factor (ECF subfamily)
VPGAHRYGAAATPLGVGLDGHLAAAVRGERVSLDFILRSVRPFVIRYCRARLGRGGRTFARADDVAEEVCTAVLTALPSYCDQGGPFLAFLYGIARRKVSDAHRAASREILILRVMSGLSAEETAEAVGSTPGAVRVAQHSALALLRARMTETRQHGR